MHPIRKAYALLGITQAEFARRLGVTKACVWQWENERPVPSEHCPTIEKMTRGEVRCEELRPDLADGWSYLRNADGLHGEAHVSA